MLFTIPVVGSSRKIILGSPIELQKKYISQNIRIIFKNLLPNSH